MRRLDHSRVAFGRVGGVGGVVPGHPTIGPLVRENRVGLGISRRAKTTAVVITIVFAGVSGVLVATPTKEAVLEVRKSEP